MKETRKTTKERGQSPISLEQHYAEMYNPPVMPWSYMVGHRLYIPLKSRERVEKFSLPLRQMTQKEFDQINHVSAF